MKTLQVDSNNDIFLGAGGNLSLVKDQEAIMSICAHYAKAALGEMVAKADKGMPFFQTVFSARADIALFEANFRKRMKEISGVIAVRSFEGYQKDGTLFYNATIETIYGLGSINSASL